MLIASFNYTRSPSAELDHITLTAVSICAGPWQRGELVGSRPFSHILPQYFSHKTATANTNPSNKTSRDVCRCLILAAQCVSANVGECLILAAECVSASVGECLILAAECVSANVGESNLTHWQTDRRTNVTSLTSLLAIFATELKNVCSMQRRSCLRHCATSRKVAGSIPDHDIGIFHWLHVSGCTIALGSIQHRTEISPGDISYG